MCKQRPRNEGICELFPISWVIKLLYLLWITRTKRGYQPCNNLKGLCRYESSVNEAFPAWYLLWLKHTKKKKCGNNFLLSTILLSFNHFTQKQGALREILLGRDTYPNIVFLAEKTKNWLVHKAVVANPLILTCCWRVMGLSESIFVGFHNSSFNHLWSWKLHVLSCASSYCNIQMTLLRGFSCTQMNTWKITVLLKVSLELEKLFLYCFFLEAVATRSQSWSCASSWVRCVLAVFFIFITDCWYFLFH